MEIGNPNFFNKTLSPISKPKSLVCYICGQGFGTKSLGIHLKTCEQKWNQEQEKKPKNQQRPLPQPPVDLDSILKCENITWENMEKYNVKATEIYNNEGLVKCEFCNRTFFAEKIEGHLKICSKERPMSPLKINSRRNTERNLSTPRMDCNSSFYNSENKKESAINLLQTVEENTSALDKKTLKKGKKNHKNNSNSNIANIASNPNNNIEEFTYTDSFVVPTAKNDNNNNNNTVKNNDNNVNNTTITNITNTTNDNNNNNNNTALTIDKKHTESFVKKIKMDKKLTTNEEKPGSPRQKAIKNLSKAAIIEKEKEAKSNNELSKELMIIENILSKVNENRNKGSFAKPTESSSNKLNEQRKKSMVTTKSPKESLKKKTPKDPQTNLNNNKEQTERTSDIKNIIIEDETLEAKKQYKIYTPAKTLDFNY